MEKFKCIKVTSKAVNTMPWASLEIHYPKKIGVDAAVVPVSASSM